ncbi:MAG TPA: 2-nitropropane dioxygenase [Halieaceae bacterium]|jgi:NAD(P)H-dependent flavin oxidoreductase YrpB (nitropropane dioxygenase family)|uniref:NAD(P)H-dependent flavin oxidoreductase n=1 Tax=Haliea TaxID=475794 RepID=UPI000C42B8CF|nr:nitronate monooxygenase [Haliea sp.]MAD64811.1 2-nitropropane dioxygenase [Haliea sp.]MAY94317.1 2-nitropropane dioxygenase [Haliea sp.]MBP71011.1 2-nitropropane dioxygenase [Haliea sp.]HBQ39718.1 2-nitropropane dioxygenase [Halieaceae bacterium]|tara:strand:- start:3 stop:1076 length:1074 start_codon:yes stop_codon:yes gene_type:complete
MLTTRLTELLGCRYPIVQTAMGWVADPRLVAGSCNAGGFGFLAGATIPPEEMERDILQVKALTDRPFGVNFHMYQPNAADIIDMVIRHGVRAVSYSRSPGPEMIRKLKDAGVICMPTVGLPKHAVKAVELGADAVTVQGGEGGGHTGAVPTTLLIPQVVDAVGAQVPVVAAGGFKDGRGLVAALAWGADGVAMGTRFLLTRESPVPDATKQRYLECKNPADIVVSRAMDGMPQRMIMNELLTELERASKLRKLIIAMRNGLAFRKYTGASVVGLLKSAIAMSRSDDMTAAQAIMSANAPMIIQKAMVDGQPARGVLPSGQVAGVIDTLLTCEELIQSIVDEAESRLQALAARAAVNP